MPWGRHQQGSNFKLATKIWHCLVANSEFTLQDENLLWKHKIDAFSITSGHWNVTGRWNPSSLKIWVCLSYIDHSMADDHLVMQGARASVTMLLLSYCSQNIAATPITGTERLSNHHHNQMTNGQEFNKIPFLYCFQMHFCDDSRKRSLMAPIFIKMNSSWLGNGLVLSGNKPFITWVNMGPRSMTHIQVSCQKGPICHASAWRVGPYWQDTLDKMSPRTPFINFNSTMDM